MMKSDFDELCAAASDPLIWEQHPNPNRYKKDEFEIFFLDGIKSGGALVAICQNTGKIIGTSRFNEYSLTQSQVEIGFTFLTRAHWGGEMNRQMKKLMLDHAFKYVDVVVFVVGEFNLRSQKAVEKIDGKLRRKYDRSILGGPIRRVWEFEILKSDYRGYKI